MRINALANHGWFPFQAARNGLGSSICIPGVPYTVNWRPFTVLWINWDPIACCLFFLLLSVLLMICQCASWVILSMAALAESHWTNCCLHCSCDQASDTSVEAPIERLDSDPLSPGSDVCVTVISCGGVREQEENETKWDVLRNTCIDSRQNGIYNGQLLRCTQDVSSCVWLEVGGGSPHPAICSQSVRCYSCVFKDTLWCMPAEIT